ncbi:MAG: PBSX family phage terminase large subunit [Ruminococcus sp.]|nr:PBSX family phage terminase large subunit [Ruminococcus sp.]
MRLNPKQNEYIRESTSRWNIKAGAVRSGKSYCDIAYVIPARLRAVKDYPGLNVIIGVSKETIERNVLQPMREIYTADVVGTINSRNIAMVCGVPVYCLGAAKSSQVAMIQGMSIKYCYGDEIAKWSPNVFDMLKSRLDKPYSRFDGSCNPESPGHWLKQFIDSEGLDIYVQKYTIFDNPALSPDFVENLCKEYEGTVFYQRYILGEWTLAEGLIYPMYDKAIETPPEGKAEQYVLSIDYGTLNAFAALLWGKYGEVWYAIDGYYYSGRDTGQQLTDEEYGQEIDKRFREFSNEWNKLRVIVDPSAASFITLLKKKRCYRVIPADNAVIDGIRETATAIQTGKIKVSPKLKEWQREAEGYVWDDNPVEDRPIKVNDHYMDSTRYFVKTLKLIYPKYQRNIQIGAYL